MMGLLEFLILRRRPRPRVYRWVCACGYRKRERFPWAETRECPYCWREITPERMS